MTFADKKVEEFENKFKQAGLLEEKYIDTNEKITDWLKQTIAEAEKEGMRNICFFANRRLSDFLERKSGQSPIFEGYKMACMDIISDCQQKLKELEGE
jgi:DNA repair protein RadC